MNPGRVLIVLRAALVAGVMASGALENDYRHAGDPAFCGVESACLKVRTSEVGKEIAGRLAEYGVTLPQIALLAFIILLVYSFFLRSRTYLQAFAAVTTCGGIIALLLIGAQAAIHTLCLYCMIVDTSTLIATAGALVLVFQLRTEKDLERRLAPSMVPAMTFLWGVVAAIATGAPYVWAAYPKNQPLPKPIAEMQVDGKITIVSITDFECPFCRAAHPTLTKLRERPDVAFKRVMAPLPMHPGAEPAALAYLCAPEDKKNELAEKLYGADPTELTPEGVVKIASNVGVDVDAMKDCMFSDATHLALIKDMEVFSAVGGQGLPTTFIGRQVFVGFSPERTPEKMLASIEHANEHPIELPTFTMFLLVGGALLGIAAFAWKRVDVAPDKLPEKGPVDSAS